MQHAQDTDVGYLKTQVFQDPYHPVNAQNSWVRDRLRTFDGEQRKARNVIVHPFQDDSICLVVGTIAARKMTDLMYNMTKALRIPLSEKPESNKPFATRFDALGATFDIFERTFWPSQKEP